MQVLAERILGDNDLAKDAVQLAFSKIYSKLDQFDGWSQLKTSMHRIVVNEALMILRKGKRANEESIDHLLPSFDRRGMRIPNAPVAGQTSEATLSSKQTVSTIRKTISELPASRRRVPDLHLRVCPDCRRYIADYRRTLDALKDLKAENDGSLADVPENLIQAILKANSA